MTASDIAQHMAESKGRLKRARPFSYEWGGKKMAEGKMVYKTRTPMGDAEKDAGKLKGFF